MIRTDRLIGEMAAQGISGKKMAEKLGIAPKTFYTKMKRGVFGTDEVEIMIKELKLSDPMAIFFADNVTWKVTNEYKEVEHDQR